MNVLLAKNYVADIALPRFRLVKQGSADDHITLATGSLDTFIGTTMDIPAAPNERSDVHMLGIAYLEAGAAFSSGTWITSDSIGRGIAASPAAGINASVIGRALETANAAGDVIRVLVAHGQIQG
jgi:hypothetical protein